LKISQIIKDLEKPVDTKALETGIARDVKIALAFEMLRDADVHVAHIWVDWETGDVIKYNLKLNTMTAFDPNLIAENKFKT
jgi:hypothetical protein